MATYYRNEHRLKNDNDQILKSVYPSPIIISASSLVILNGTASSKEELGFKKMVVFKI